MADYGVIHGMVFPVLMFPCTVLYAVPMCWCRSWPVPGRENQRRIHHVAGRCLRQGFLYAAAVAALLWLLAMPLGQLLYRSDDAGRYLRLFAPAW